jgi:hypothetical protein
VNISKTVTVNEADRVVSFVTTLTGLTPVERGQIGAKLQELGFVGRKNGPWQTGHAARIDPDTRMTQDAVEYGAKSTVLTNVDLEGFSIPNDHPSVKIVKAKAAAVPTPEFHENAWGFAAQSA